MMMMGRCIVITRKLREKRKVFVLDRSCVMHLLCSPRLSTSTARCLVVRSLSPFLPDDRSTKIFSRLGIETLQGFCKQNQKFSTGLNNNDIFANRQTVGKMFDFRSSEEDSFQVRLLQSLYEASLYKLEKVYNHLKKLPEPQYEHAQRFAKSANDKVRF